MSNPHPPVMMSELVVFNFPDNWQLGFMSWQRISSVTQSEVFPTHRWSMWQMCHAWWWDLKRHHVSRLWSASLLLILECVCLCLQLYVDKQMVIVCNVFIYLSFQELFFALHCNYYLVKLLFLWLNCDLFQGTLCMIHGAADVTQASCFSDSYSSSMLHADKYEQMSNKSVKFCWYRSKICFSLFCFNFIAL